MKETRTSTICLVCVVLLAVGACTVGRSTSSPNQRRAVPMSRQILTVGALADGYDKEVPGRPDLGKYPFNTSMFDTLVRMDENLQVQPRLAERWELDEPNNTYTFFLRRGVRFHDDAELTADDVKYTFDLITRAYPTNYQTLGPNSVKVIDSHTVQITPMKKNNRLVQQLVHPIWGINRSGTTEAKPVGAGPYQFVEYVKNDHLTVRRFDKYWDSSRAARAQQITFKFVPDAQTRVLALRSGDIDLAVDVPRAAADQLRHTPEVQVVNSKVGAYNALNFNIAGIPPYDLGKDAAVREAVASAIDRRAVLSRVWANNAAVSTTWVPPAVLGASASLISGAAFSPQHAKTLLDQDGWKPGSDGIRVKDGRRLSLDYLIQGPGDTDPQDSVAAAQFIQDELKQVGVEIKIEVPEAAAASARLSQGQYDLTQGIGNQNEANPCFLPDLIYYSKSGSASAKYRAPGGATDAAIEGCRSATSIEQVRTSAAQAIHELVDIQHVVIPLIGLYRIWGLKSTVAGFVPHPSLTNQRWEGINLVG